MQRLKLLSIYFGNLFEHYDVALYSFLSPFFAKIFFPEQDNLTALILTFAIAPLGMIARPIGSLFFGFIGDTKGRSRALFLSLTGMALVTAFIGLMPTAHHIGQLAPLLLLITRILQNFFGAGEIMGGAIYYLESVQNEKQKDLASSIYGTSTVVGILFASGLVAFLYHYDWVESGWRWLYLGGAVTALFGVVIRYFSPEEIPPDKHQSQSILSRLKIINKNRGVIFIIALVSGFSYATYSIAFSFMNAFAPLITTIDESTVAKINTGLLFLDILLLPLFGALASRFNRLNMMLLSSLAALIFGMPLFYFLENSPLYTFVLLRICFVVIGVWFSATFYSWAESLVSKENRYSVISFAYSIGSQLFGGTAAAISLWLYKHTSLVTSAACYWILLGGLTFVCLYKTKHLTPKKS